MKLIPSESVTVSVRAGPEEQLDGGEQRRGGSERGQCRRAGQRSPLVPRAVAERRVAAGDADGVQLPRAELLISRGRDQTRSRRRARLPVVNPCTNTVKHSLRLNVRTIHPK